MKQFIEWCALNKDLLAYAVSTILLGLGMVLEGLNLLFPTKDKSSFLEKAGKLVSKITAKLPSNIKKPEIKDAPKS